MIKKTGIVAAVVILLTCFAQAAQTTLFASGFEPGEPVVKSKIYTTVSDPLGSQGQVLVAEVSKPNKYRQFKIPFSDLDGNTVYVSFKAFSPDGVRAAVVVNQGDKGRQRIKLIDKLSNDWKEYRETIPIIGNGSGEIEIVAPSSWGAPAGKAYLDDIRVTIDGVAEEPITAPAPTASTDRPNILFITMDDMNYDSIGAYGCDVPDISPHIDSLAESGLSFERAFVQTTTCAPSRNVFQSGRYPHSSGIRGFYNVDPDFKILPELLREKGYITGVINKPRDTSPNNNYDQFWNFHVILLNDIKRTPSSYQKNMDEFMARVKEDGRPFYCVVNIADPHKPFFNDPKAESDGFDKNPPSKIYEPDDVDIPAFLPTHPEIQQEMANYYNSVKRGDDCVGVVLDSLKQSGLQDNTIIVFVSDHGMPLPYAKSSMYPDGTRTPWIVVWPGTVSPASMDRDHMISAIDFAPTVLEMAGLEQADGMQGRSIVPILKGEKQEGRNIVFTEFNETAGGVAQPMRAVYQADRVYIFNPWSTGEHQFISAANWYQSYGVMKRLAQNDPAVKKRFEFLEYRAVEELYDLAKDPHALNNIIDNPEYAGDLKQLRGELEEWMRSTEDYALPSFAIRDDPDQLKAFMKQTDDEALERAGTLQWKRWNNRTGAVGGNTKLYKKEPR